MRGRTLFVAGLLALAAAPAASAQDFASRTAFNILPPGESGAVPPAGPNARDQLQMYDALTPLFGGVSAGDVPRVFKPNIFGVRRQGPTHVEPTPRAPALRIVRDRFGVAHVYGRTRDDVMYGSGWVSAEDRSAIMEILRGPARLAALDAVPGLNPLTFAGAGGRFIPSPATEAFMDRQADALAQRGARGQRILRDIDEYVAGINDNYRAKLRPYAPWGRNDVFAMVSLLAGVFGQGGGDEAARSALLDALQQRLGADMGWNVWDDLRDKFDSETDVSVDGRFPYGRSIRGGGPGNAIIDDGSLSRTGLGEAGPLGTLLGGVQPEASNALLVSARRSITGHPLMVAGPQVGYFYPQVLMEVDLHGGGIDARGVGVPGFANALVIGRGKDFAWSLTSAGNDLVDEYVETLCGNDLTYMYKGQCRPMDVFDAGLVEGDVASPGSLELAVRSTVHGPVVAYGTVNGRRVAISQKRSTRGREVLSAFPIEDLMTNKVRSAADFRRSFSRGFEATFNAFYVDNRDIAMVSTGRLPVRPPGIDSGLPTIGDGRFEWQGFLPARAHPQDTNPRDGTILNWNNKPAKGWGASDNEWSYGSVVREEMFRAGMRRRRHTATTVVRAMNRAATQDLRNDQVFPSIDAILRTGPAPNAGTARMVQLLRDWRARGSSRLDRDLDGKIDDPGAAIMDKAWEPLTDAVLGPLVGPQLDQLARLNPRDNAANDQGSSYNDGWYGYVDKDLRTILTDSGRSHRRVRGRFHERYCGRGDLAACRISLYAALDEAGRQLEASQGGPPDSWRSDAGDERIHFLPGLMPDTMRWTNRPTFQQVISFSGHRARRAARRPHRHRAPHFTG